MNSQKPAVSNAAKVIMNLLVGLLLITVMLVGLKYAVDDQKEKEIFELKKLVLEMNTAVSIDAIRQFNIQKIITIMDQYNTVMPRQNKYVIAEEIYNMTLKYATLNVDLMCATITHESAGTWNPNIKSPAGAMGLMQIMPATGMFIAAQEGISWTSAQEILYDPIYNIRMGARYLSSLIELYDVDGGLAAYNGGETRAALWLGSGKKSGILAKETQHYIPAIQRLYQEYASQSM